jgi:hypothetical protein
MNTTSPPEPLSSPAPSRPARILVGLYPQAWRTRYGAEVLDLINGSGLSLSGGWDLLRGALDAHLHPNRTVPAATDLVACLNRTTLRTLTAWLGFCVAAFGLAKATEEPVFIAVAHTRPALSAAYHLAELAFLVAFLGVLTGGLPLALAALRQALLRRDRRALLLFATPPSMAGLWLAGLWQLARLHVTWQAHPVLARGALAAWFLLGLAATALSLSAVGGLLRHTMLSARQHRIAVAAQTLTASAIAVAAVAFAGYGLVLRSQEPSLFHSDNGIVATPLPLTWGAVVVVATAVAAAAVMAAADAVKACRQHAP